MNTEEKIIIASTKVFKELGYLGASTRLIAETAKVSEMTLFRKFKSKQNLFEMTLKFALGHELLDVFEADFTLSLEEFVRKFLHNRLSSISKNIDLVRMFIEESLQGRIPKEMNYIARMSEKLTNTLQEYQKIHNEPLASSLNVIILGILLQYVIMNSGLSYHSKSPEEQETYINSLSNQIKF
ncbi:MAG: TetR/AcrR family transcriptional regulator [Tenericutes bacterium]|nr:TetR/AcrR family transcriptional regulator [Mycoplasmatota bacterium]